MTRSISWRQPTSPSRATCSAASGRRGDLRRDPRSTRVLIKNNVIYNSVTTDYGGIDPGVLATTGIVRHNAITSLYATAVAKTVATRPLWL